MAGASFFSTSSTATGINANDKTSIVEQVVQLLQETVQLSPTHNKILWDVLAEDPKLLCRLAKGIAKESNVSSVQDENVEAELKSSIKLLKMECYELKLNRLEQNITVKPIEEVKSRLKGKIFPPRILELVEESALKLSSLGKRDYEYREAKPLFDWLTSLPWGIRGGNMYNFNYKQAEALLNERVYGLGTTKKNVLEFMRSTETNSNAQKKILCLVGPPGTGKSLMAKAMAEVLHRKFAEIPCMGVTAHEIIRGNASYNRGLGNPGIIVRKLKELQIENPVLLVKNLEQVFKKRDDHNCGGVPSEVLQFLHPNQNKECYDQYLNIPFDFSAILFVCTATTIEAIPPVLLPFVEVVQVTGYLFEEKEAILNKFLLPELTQEFGLGGIQTQGESIWKPLLQRCSGESGLTELKKALRKIVLNVMGEQSSGGSITISSEDVARNLPQLHDPSNYITVTSITRSTNQCEAAYLNANGGQPCVIEVGSGKPQLMPAEQKITAKGIDFEFIGGSSSVVAPALAFLSSDSSSKLLGKFEIPLGTKLFVNFRSLTSSDSVLQERQDDLSKEFYNNYRSIGGAIVVAVWSVCRQHPIKLEVGILAEVTSTGSLLPLDNLEERVKALVRVGVLQIVLPAKNAEDIQEFPSVLRELVKFFLAADMGEAIKFFQ